MPGGRRKSKKKTATKPTRRATRPPARNAVSPQPAPRAAPEQEELRSLFEEAPVGYHEIDTAGIVRRVNRTECEMLGFEPREIIGKAVWELVAPQERAISRDAVRKKLAGKEPLGVLERMYIRRDGSILHVEIHENAIRNAKGAIVGIRSAMLDITVRRQAEIALRQSEAQLRAILDHTGAVVYIKDLEGRYLLVNRRYESVSHVAQQQILGKTDYDLYPRQIADVFFNNDQRVLETRSSTQFEEVDYLEDGKHTYLSVKVPLLDANGEPYAVCGISTDITDRKRTLESLRSSEEQFRQLFENANDIVYTLDLEGNFTSFNRVGE
jgi:PAS domain S-box-containing protein